MKSAAADGAVKLFSPIQISLTTFLGGLLGGFLVMAVNFLRLKRVGAAVASVVAGLALLLGTVKLLLSSPSMMKVPGMLVTVAMTLLMLAIASIVQGRIFDEHKKNGGEMVKGAKALIVLVPAIIISAVIGIVVVLALMPKGI